MEYINIGDSCTLTVQLKRKGKSHFFDSIVSSLKTVIDVLSTRDANAMREKLSSNNRVIPNTQSVVCESFDKLISMHDIPYRNNNPDTLHEMFVERYVRRYIRLLDLIRTNPNITFVHCCKCKVPPFDEGIIRALFAQLNTLNPENNFKLIILCLYVPDALLLESIRNINDNIICEDLKSYHIKRANEADWMLTYLDWNAIWKKCGVILA